MALDPYLELGVGRTASAQDIDTAWKRRRRQVHPDYNPDDPFAAAKFQQAKEAYEILSDLRRRAKFDAEGSTDTPEALRERAILIVVGVLEQVIESVDQRNLYATATIISSVRDTMRNMLAHGDREAPQGNRRIEGLERLLKRVRRKDGGESVIADVIQDRIDGLIKERAARVVARIELVEALKIIDEYEDVDDFQAAASLWLTATPRYISFDPMSG